MTSRIARRLGFRRITHVGSTSLRPRGHPTRAVLRLRGDDGTSLIVAMAFLSLLGVFVISLMTMTFSSFKNTESTRSVDKRLYGADGAVDVAIQSLRDSGTYCPEVTTAAQTMPTQTVNGRTVQVTCQTMSGSAGGGGTVPNPSSYALIVTGYTGADGKTPTLSSLISGGGSHGGQPTLSVLGHAFNAGGFSLGGGAPKLLFTQDLHEYNSPSTYCTTAKNAAVSSDNPHVNGTWTCEPTTFPVPDPAPTVKVPTTAAPAPFVFNSNGYQCTVYFPGKYTSANAPTFSTSSRYYFASGVYYFENLGKMNFAGEIFGGEPLAPETKAFNSSYTPCWNDFYANYVQPGSATGNGVELVLGGTSYIDVKNSSSERMELFSRQPPTGSTTEGTAGISIYAPRTAGTGYLASTAAKVIVTGGSQSEVVIHGFVYAPRAAVDYSKMPNDDAGNVSMFAGGLECQKLDVQINDDTVGARIASLPAPIPPTPRTVVVTATASGLDPGEAATTIQAVVQLGTSSSAPPTILSWRKV